MNLILIPFFQHAGLALAISIGASFNALLLFYSLKKIDSFKISVGTPLFIFKVILSGLLMGLGLLMVLPSADFWTILPLFNRVFWLLFYTGLGIILYFLTLLIVGIRPNEFLRQS
jgi:putative peptidoglycan lipid II flippase